MEIDIPIGEAKIKTKQSLRIQVREVVPVGTQLVRLKAIKLVTSKPTTGFEKKLNGKEDQVIVISDDTENVKSNDLIQVVVGGVWTQNPITKNAIIHLVNPSYEAKSETYYVDNSDGFLVLDPDSLLTCTHVASSLFCERKTWLNHVFLGQVGTNRAMLVGTLVHEVFQYGVKKRIADIAKLVEYLDELLDDATIMLEIYSVEMHVKDVRAEAVSYISSVKEWIEKYMFAGPRYPLTNDSNIEVKIIGVCDIEENVWSTKYGLKGKIDVTGAVRVYDKRTKVLADKTIPLELKTGNPNLSSSHAAQVSLYSMMIEDRYAETNQGFVIYLKDKAAMHNVALTHNIKRDLVQRRNQINYHMGSHYFGPDMIDQPRMCTNCERLTECILMSNLYTPNKINSFPNMKALESEATGHLNEPFNKFFQKYHEKLALIMTKSVSVSTNGDAKALAASFWNISSEEAELNGTGLGKLQASCTTDKSEAIHISFKRHPKYLDKIASDLESSSNSIDSNGSEISSQPTAKKQKILDYFKPMKKSPEIAARKCTKPFNTEANLSRCRVAISLDSDDATMDSQNSSTAIAIGFVTQFTSDCFAMKLFEGCTDVFKPDLMYRVDRIEKKTNLDIERLVLIRLMMRGDWRCDRVRQLILDPKFEPIENIEFNLFVLSAGFEEISELDSSGQKFVVEAVSTDNYYILDEQTEPSKFKVNKIVAVLTRVIGTVDRSVLIVAPSIDHLVDLMRQLQSRKVRFILIDDGKSTKARYQYASNLVKVPQSDALDLNRKFDSYIRQHELANVVITTYAMSIGGLVFTRKTFDYCICYDCDSTELLSSLSPMFCSDRFIIIDVKESSGKEEMNGDKRPVADKEVPESLGDHLRALRPRR